MKVSLFTLSCIVSDIVVGVHFVAWRVCVSSVAKDFAKEMVIVYSLSCFKELRDVFKFTSIFFSLHY